MPYFTIHYTADGRPYIIEKKLRPQTRKGRQQFPLDLAHHPRWCRTPGQEQRNPAGPPAHLYQ